MYFEAPNFTASTEFQVFIMNDEARECATQNNGVQVTRVRQTINYNLGSGPKKFGYSRVVLQNPDCFLSSFTLKLLLNDLEVSLTGIIESHDPYLQTVTINCQDLQLLGEYKLNFIVQGPQVFKIIEIELSINDEFLDPDDCLNYAMVAFEDANVTVDVNRFIDTNGYFTQPYCNAESQSCKVKYEGADHTCSKYFNFFNHHPLAQQIEIKPNTEFEGEFEIELYSYYKTKGVTQIIKLFYAAPTCILSPAETNLTISTFEIDSSYFDATQEIMDFPWVCQGLSTPLTYDFVPGNTVEEQGIIYDNATKKLKFQSEELYRVDKNITFNFIAYFFSNRLFETQITLQLIRCNHIDNYNYSAQTNTLSLFLGQKGYFEFSLTGYQVCMPHISFGVDGSDGIFAFYNNALNIVEILGTDISHLGTKNLRLDFNHRGSKITFRDVAAITFSNPCDGAQFQSNPAFTQPDISYQVGSQAKTIVMPEMAIETSQSSEFCKIKYNMWENSALTSINNNIFQFNNASRILTVSTFDSNFYNTEIQLIYTASLQYLAQQQKLTNFKVNFLTNPSDCSVLSIKIIQSTSLILYYIGKQYQYQIFNFTHEGDLILCHIICFLSQISGDIFEMIEVFSSEESSNIIVIETPGTVSERTGYFNLLASVDEHVYVNVQFYVKVIPCVPSQTHTIDAQSTLVGGTALSFNYEPFLDEFCGGSLSSVETYITYEGGSSFPIDNENPCSIDKISKKIGMQTDDPRLVGSYSCYLNITFQSILEQSRELIIRYNFRIECSVQSINTSLALAEYLLSPSNTRIDISFGLIPQCQSQQVAFHPTDIGLPFLQVMEKV